MNNAIYSRPAYGRAVYGRVSTPTTPGNPLVMSVDPRAATLVSQTSNPFAVDGRAATLVS